MNNLQYWGLDYPPLTAYHSLIAGTISAYMHPDWINLRTSRGYESYDHKLFMRYSVLVTDISIFFTAVTAFVCYLTKYSKHSRNITVRLSYLKLYQL